MASQIARAQARIGLLGNPSDGFEGRVIAFTIADFAATVELCDRRAGALGVRLLPGTGAEREDATWEQLFAALAAGELRGGAELCAAALKRFAGHCQAAGSGPACLSADEPALSFELSFESDVPRQVGLAGSSAIVVATLRALAQRFGVELAPFDLAQLALRAETDELGLAAGPQDRVVQAYEGLLDMDFRAPCDEDSYTRLDPALLPPLFLAWDPGPGESSGVAHGVAQERFTAGDAELERAIAELIEIAAKGRRALEAGDTARLAELVDANFAARASAWPIRARDRQLVELGRRAGAGVKFAGSGGAVVGVLRDEANWSAIEAAYGAAGVPTLRPTVHAPLLEEPAP